jgi:chromosome segregation ATPase
MNEFKEENKRLQDEVKSNNEKLNKYKNDYKDIGDLNGKLEKMRDKITEENTKLKNKVDHFLEEIRLKENMIQELDKKVTDAEKKVKAQREVYDAVRRDKNLYFKTLIETQDDLVDKQGQLTNHKKEIENLKADLKKKDENIVNLKSKNSSLEDEAKTKELEINKFKHENDYLKQSVSTQEKEIAKLKIVVEETSKDYKKLEGEYKKTIIDRDNLCIHAF